jgi:hypothetical protein
VVSLNGLDFRIRVKHSGISVRSNDDWAFTYILDSVFGRFLRNNKLSNWYTEAIADLGQCVLHLFTRDNYELNQIQ